MKIKYVDDQQLFLEHRPYFLCGVLGFFIIGFAWGLLANWTTLSHVDRGFTLGWLIALIAVCHYLVRWVRVRFDRSAGQIEVWSMGLCHDSAKVYPMRMLKAVDVLANYSEGSTFRRLALSFDKSFESWLPDDHRRELEKNIRIGWVQHKLHQVPLTKFSSTSKTPRRIADEINTWLAT